MKKKLSAGKFKSKLWQQFIPLQLEGLLSEDKNQQMLAKMWRQGDKNYTIVAENTMEISPKTNLPYYLAIPLLSICTKEMKSCERNNCIPMFTAVKLQNQSRCPLNVHSFIYYTCINIHSYTHNRLLFIKRNHHIYSKMYRTRGQYQIK